MSIPLILSARLGQCPKLFLRDVMCVSFLVIFLPSSSRAGFRRGKRHRPVCRIGTTPRIISNFPPVVSIAAIGRDEWETGAICLDAKELLKALMNRRESADKTLALSGLPETLCGSCRKHKWVFRVSQAGLSLFRTKDAGKRPHRPSPLPASKHGIREKGQCPNFNIRLLPCSRAGP